MSTISIITIVFFSILMLGIAALLCWMLYHIWGELVIMYRGWKMRPQFVRIKSRKTGLATDTRLTLHQLNAREMPSVYFLEAVSEVLPGQPDVHFRYIIGDPAHSGKEHIVTPSGGQWDKIVVRV